jgi:hypothetical protein
MMLTMRRIKRHYDRVEDETRCDEPLYVKDLTPPLVVIPIERWSVIAQKAVRFAWKLSPEIMLLHVDCGDDADEMRNRWREQVEKPATAAGLPVPELVTLKSRFRFVVRPILDYILALEQTNPHRQIAVIIPELVENRWYYNLLHNNRSTTLKALLLFTGDHRIVVINIPWYLND